MSLGDIYVYAISGIIYLFIFYVILFTIYYKVNETLAKAIAPVFVLCDFFVNTIHVSILFLEPPKWKDREFLVTARLKRWKKYPDNVTGIKKARRDFSWWMCDKLSKYDEGHC